MADLTTEWRSRATAVLGQDATTWARNLTNNNSPLLLRADDVPLETIEELGTAVVIHHPDDRLHDGLQMAPRTAWRDQLVSVTEDGGTSRELWVHRRLPA